MEPEKKAVEDSAVVENAKVGGIIAVFVVCLAVLGYALVQLNTAMKDWSIRNVPSTISP